MSDASNPPQPNASPKHLTTTLTTVDDARNLIALKTMTQMALAIEHPKRSVELSADTPLLQSVPSSEMTGDALTDILAAQINTLDIAYHYLLNRAHTRFEDVANFRTACHTQNQCLRSLRLLAHLKAKQNAATSASHSPPQD